MTSIKSLVSLLAISLFAAGCGGGSSRAGGGGSFGLTERPANAACLALTQGATGEVSTQRAFPALNLGDIVTGLYQAPNDASRWYATLKSGSIVSFSDVDNASSVTAITGEPTVDDRSEGGLLSMAFHPDFGTGGNRYVYLSYTARNSDDTMQSRITRYVLGTDNRLSSPLRILTVAQPSFNHNGGNISFGPDGFLYIGFGDGGGSGDEYGNGQNPQTFLSKILRIDVNSGSPYSVPSSNPFYGSSTHLDEIYAQGFRNPWRWSFDRMTGDLIVADVGQHNWEEVNRVTAGQNYGWPITEGNHCYEASSCNRTGLTAPIYEYNHEVGCSITGGFVYRGSDIPALQGRFVYGDYCMTGVQSFVPANPAATHAAISASGGAPNAITSFGEANDGELLMGTASGELYRFVHNDNAAGPVVPERLSDHPCFSNASMQELQSGVVPYSLNSPLWSDGAEKQRFFAIPDGRTITVDARGDFIFPVGSVLIKNFLHDDRLIETRFLMHEDGGWAGYNYEWNDQGTDATLSTTAHTRVIDDGYTHIFPSSSQCFQCHTSAANITLGPETAQLNGNQRYPGTGITSNQLETLQHVGFFTATLSTSQRERIMPALEDSTASLASRARAYLHSNCSGCHQPGGFPNTMDLRYDTPLADTGICNVEPVAGDLGISGGRLIVPGNLETSVLYQRMARRDSFQMPPLATNVVDEAALNVMSAWIEGMNGCD